MTYTPPLLYFPLIDIETKLRVAYNRVWEPASVHQRWEPVYRLFYGQLSQQLEDELDVTLEDPVNL